MGWIVFSYHVAAKNVATNRTETNGECLLWCSQLLQCGLWCWKLRTHSNHIHPRTFHHLLFATCNLRTAISASSGTEYSLPSTSTWEKRQHLQRGGDLGDDHSSSTYSDLGDDSTVSTAVEPLEARAAGANYYCSLRLLLATGF